ncbi:hypothetical protein BXZ70DRAFT_211240 [Cristinia sonorae]|uniref:Uncharacterized protein n=1 Tax=Cristinia sonorae TaxID=1940300 RepID=A0A8K0UM08_9AGAR|nr:hypothetical protein BXZ70DRAFT_211240 [Cristinia sonorae]
MRDLDPEQYGVAATVHSITWTTTNVGIEGNWATTRSVTDDTYNEPSPLRCSSLDFSTPSSSLPSQDMNHTPHASRPYQYVGNRNRPAAVRPCPTNSGFFRSASFSHTTMDQDLTLDATASWASCSSWASTSSSSLPHGRWQQETYSSAAFPERTYSSNVECSPISPFILPQLSRDCSISPPSNPRLHTPTANTSEAHLEPAIADAFAEVMRAFDHHEVWVQPEEEHRNLCHRSPETGGSAAAHPSNHYALPDYATLLDNLMQVSTDSDSAFSGHIQVQPHFESLPPSAFELDQTSPVVPEPLVLHHPRPRRPYVPRWQCDPEYDFDQFSSSLLASKSSSHRPLDASNSDQSYMPSIPEDVSSDDDVDFVDDDSDMDVEDDVELEDYEYGSPHYSEFSSGEEYSRANFVGPSVTLEPGSRTLEPQALLFQPVSDRVKNLYHPF